jgi:two-component system, chemotaxis family, protein-glutamate methylesterase/glutaminase
MSEAAGRIRVVIVDDSALMRTVLTEIINDTPDLEVVGAAPDPLVAREMIRALNPDVITLDVEMPKMDGLSFLERLMRLRPMPVVMISSLTDAGAQTTLRALELGAVDFVSKPKLDLDRNIRGYAQEITEKLRVAARARVGKFVAPSASPRQQDVGGSTLPPRASAAGTDKIIVIGASTGGTEAIREVLSGMTPDCPGILVTQHMPEAFTRSFANRLNTVCRIAVKEAQSGERVLPGHAYIAPGHSHLLLRRSGGNYMTELSSEPPVNRHRPAVDVLFHSAAQHAGRHALAVLLTGMGKDGATGMFELKQAGAYTIAQDEASCVVFGMPREAIARGAVDEVLPLTQIAARLAVLGGGYRAMRV